MAWKQGDTDIPTDVFKNLYLRAFAGDNHATCLLCNSRGFLK